MKEIKKISVEVVYALIVGVLVLFSCLTENYFQTSRYGIFAFISIIVLVFLALNTLRYQVLLEENKMTTNSTGLVSVVFFVIIAILISLIYLLSWIIKFDFWKTYMLAFSSSAVFILAKNLLKIFYSQTNLKVFYRQETLLDQNDEESSENIETNNEADNLPESKAPEEEICPEKVIIDDEESEPATVKKTNEEKPAKKTPKLVFPKKKTDSPKSEASNKTKKKKSGQNAAKSFRGLFPRKVERDVYDDPELYEQFSEQLDD